MDVDRNKEADDRMVMWMLIAWRWDDPACRTTPPGRLGSGSNRYASHAAVQGCIHK